MTIESSTTGVGFAARSSLCNASSSLREIRRWRSWCNCERVDCGKARHSIRPVDGSAGLAARSAKVNPALLTLEAASLCYCRNSRAVSSAG